MELRVTSQILLPAPTEETYNRRREGTLRRLDAAGKNIPEKYRDYETYLRSTHEWDVRQSFFYGVVRFESDGICFWSSRWTRLTSFLGQLMFESKRWGQHADGGFIIYRDFHRGSPMDFRLDDGGETFSVGRVPEDGGSRIDLGTGFSAVDFTNAASDAYEDLLTEIDRSYPWAAENPSYVSLINRLRDDWTPQ